MRPDGYGLDTPKTDAPLSPTYGRTRDSPCGVKIYQMLTDRRVENANRLRFNGFNIALSLDSMRKRSLQSPTRKSVGKGKGKGTREAAMAIHSSNFGITKVTKDDATRLHRQLTYGRPNKSAVASLKEGKKILQAIQTYGYARITPKSSSR